MDMKKEKKEKKEEEGKTCFYHDLISISQYEMDVSLISQRNFHHYHAESEQKGDSQHPHMILDGVALQNLEILENASGREDGTLFKLLCYTTSAFGNER